MSVFQYKAMDKAGRVRHGRLAVPNIDDLEMRLERMGLDLIKCSPIRTTTLRLYRRNVERRDLIDFCFQLEQLTSAGVPLLQGLSDLRDTMDNPRFREIIAAIIDKIEEGNTLSSALEEFPRIFGPVFVNLIRVGEQSGTLPSVLHDLTETLKWQDEIIARAKKAMMYPAFVAVVVTGVVFFLMIYLVPQLVQFITSMEGELPAHTRALLATSKFITDYWYLLLATPAVLYGAVTVSARNSPAFRLWLDGFKLRIWFAGDLLRKMILARFSRFFALMYGAGVPVLEILRITEQITGNKAIEGALQNVQLQISQGESISNSFESTALFPPLVMRMMSVGESTGALDKALLNISYFYDRDVRERIEKIESVIEPMMTVVLGVILGWIMLSVLGPIYDLIGKIRA